MDCSRAAGAALVSATREVFGSIGRMERISFHGKTDPLILRESLAGMGFDPDDIRNRIPDLKEKYFTYLEIFLQKEQCRLMPGIKSLIMDLKREEDIILGLLTGNFAQSARIKLDRFSLFPQFSFGVYGDDGDMRDELPPVAQKRIREIHGIDLPFNRIVIIGDTVHDVRCAKHSGAVSIAVGTGWTSRDEILDEKPDYFFEDLGDIELVMGTIRSI